MLGLLRDVAYQPSPLGNLWKDWNYGALSDLLQRLPCPSRESQNVARAEFERAQQHEVQFLGFWHAQYPDSLRQLVQPPPLLCCRGNVELLTPTRVPRVAIVGARRCTSYGISTTTELSSTLAAAGGIVISGLALGIDTAAHTAAIKARGPTSGIAVLGSGILQIYPRVNDSLAREIVEHHGLVLSEFGVATPAYPSNFLQRNRIIAALADYVVVVEAAHRSGSLVTARHAIDLGKELFATPGRIDAQLSQGTNRLLSDGASPYLGVEDFSRSLTLEPNRILPRARKITLAEGGEKKASKMLEIIGSNPEISFEQLYDRLREPAPRLQAELAKLEMAGYIERLSGDRFISKGIIDT